MPRLYEVAAEFRAFADLLEQSGGEVSPDSEQRFAELTGALEDKARSIVCLIREYVTESHAIKEEADRLAALAKAKSNAADRLKEYLRIHLEACNVHQLDCGIAKVNLLKGRPSIRWEGTGLPPGEFTRVRKEIDLAAAQEALAAGQNLPEGFVVTHTPYLTIR